MKKIKRMTAVLALLTVLFLIYGCAKRTDVMSGDDYIYCLNADRTGLVKITYEVPDGDAEEMAEAVLKELAKPAEDIEYVQAIPEGVEVRSCKVDNTIAYLDFNSEYLEIPKLEEKLVRAAVVRSLLCVEEIHGVWFSVNGESLRERDGTIIGLMNTDDFVENTGALSSYETDTLTLYFANNSGDKLVKQKVDVKYSSNISKEKLIVEKLIKGPKKSGAYPTLNPNLTLLGVTVKDGICYVTFDGEFLNSVYDVKPEVVVYSLVNSLAEGTQVEKVQIMVNGEKNVTYMDTIDLSQPLLQDMSWVENTEEE